MPFKDTLERPKFDALSSNINLPSNLISNLHSLCNWKTNKQTTTTKYRFFLTFNYEGKERAPLPHTYILESVEIAWNLQVEPNTIIGV